jgi:hypothetical protein
MNKRVQSQLQPVIALGASAEKYSESVLKATTLIGGLTHKKLYPKI